MVIKLRCSTVVGDAVMKLLAAIESCNGMQPDDLQVELDLTDPIERGPAAARTHYTAKLPTLTDGTFDLHAVPATVAENLKSIGKDTINGIVYQEVVDGTLAGRLVTEREIRDRRMMKAGSSQRALVQLRHMGVIVGETIAKAM